jgi:hypothetical protein
METIGIEEIKNGVFAQNCLIRAGAKKLMEKWKEETEGMELEIETCAELYGVRHYLVAGMDDLMDEDNSPYSSSDLFIDVMPMDDLRAFLLDFPDYTLEALRFLRDKKKDNDMILNWFSSINI